MENTQYQNQEELTSENMEEVEGSTFAKAAYSAEAAAKAGSADETGNSGNGLEKADSTGSLRADPGLNQRSSQILTNLDAFLKNEMVRLQALMVDLESKRQKVERQVQINKDALEKLSQVEKRAQEIINESIKLQKENEAVFHENAREATINEDAKNEPLSLQQIWR